MTQFTDQHLSAYIDGELSEALTRQLEAELTSNKSLADRLEALRKANHEFVSAHEDLTQEDIPQALLDVLDRAETIAGEGAEIVDFSSRLEHTRAWLMPLAACLVLAIGVGLGTRLTPSSNTGSEQMIMAGKVEASSTFFEVLETLPSGETRDGFQPTLTYEMVEGGHCREVETVDLRSLACRDQVGDWNVLAVVENTSVGDAASYQPASANAAKLIDQLANELMADIPLSAADEAVLLSAWADDRELGSKESE